MSAKAKRILALLNDPKHRARLMSDVNRADQDDESAQVGNDREINALSEINELEPEERVK